MSKWILTEREFNIKNMGNYESLMYQGNGYMGIRNSFEEKYVKSNRATVINGVFNIPSGEVPEISVLEVVKVLNYVLIYTFHKSTCVYCIKC